MELFFTIIAKSNDFSWVLSLFRVGIVKDDHFSRVVSTHSHTHAVAGQNFGNDRYSAVGWVARNFLITAIRSRIICSRPAKSFLL